MLLFVKSLFSTNYLEMNDNVIKGCTMYYKTTVEGEDHVCDAVQQYAEKYAAKSYDNGKTEGINIGRNEGISIAVKALLNLVGKCIITIDAAILDSGLKKEEFYSIAESLGYKL